MQNTSVATSQTNNHWTKAKENKLLEWQQQSRIHSVAHGRAQDTYSKKNNKILIPSIAFGALAAFFDGVALIWEPQHVIFVILALLFVSVATILDGVLQTTKPSDEALAHEEMAKGYNKIVLQIDSILVKEYNERSNGSVFLTKIEEELIALKTGGAKIPSSIWETIKNAFLKGDLDFQKITKPHAGSVNVGAGGTDTVVDVDVDVDTDTVVDVDTDDEGELPSFEMFDTNNDPELVELRKHMYDYQMCRF